jgi:uncharacterized tellurite resistance protein B-like protein
MLVDLFASFADHGDVRQPGDRRRHAEGTERAVPHGSRRVDDPRPSSAPVQGRGAQLRHVHRQRVINAIVLFNKHFNENPEVRGDHTVIARGASSLIAKEVRGMALDMMAQTMQPEERKYIKWYKLAQERLKVRDVDVSDVLCDADEASQIENEEQEKAKQDAEDMKQLLAAEVRKLLAGSVKDLTAADSNAASADQKMAAGQAAVANVILDALEKGVSPTDLAALHQCPTSTSSVQVGPTREAAVDPDGNSVA